MVTKGVQGFISGSDCVWEKTLDVFGCDDEGPGRVYTTGLQDRLLG